MRNGTRRDSRARHRQARGKAPQRRLERWKERSRQRGTYRVTPVLPSFSSWPCEVIHSSNLVLRTQLTHSTKPPDPRVPALMALTNDENFLLLRRYNECLELRDALPAIRIAGDSNNNSGINHSNQTDTTDESSTDKSDDESKLPKETARHAFLPPSRDLGADNCATSSGGAASHRQSPPDGIIRPVPRRIEPDAVPTRERIVEMCKDHPGLLTVFDESKRYEASSDSYHIQSGILRQAQQRPEDHATSHRRQSVFSIAELRRTSEPACLWSATSLLAPHAQPPVWLKSF